MDKIYSVIGHCTNPKTNTEVTVLLYTNMLSEFINSDNCILLLNCFSEREPILIEKQKVYWDKLGKQIILWMI
jgi:hypothetical protein